LGVASINLPLDVPTPLRFLISVGFLLVWFKGGEIFFFFGSASEGIETLDEKSIRVFVRRSVLVAGANGTATMSIKRLASILKHIKDKPLLLGSVRLFLRTVPLLSVSVTGPGKGERGGFDV